jgi:hypothetical protein
MKYVYRIGILALLSASLMACSNTQVVSSWKASHLDNVKSIMVFTVAKTEENRRVMEEAAVTQLKLIGLDAKSSAVVLGTDIALEEDAHSLLAALAAKHSDHALVISLLKKEVKNRYVEGNTYYIPEPIFYNSFGQVYTGAFNMVREPGYYIEDNIYEVKNNLYRLSDEKLVWSTTTDTVNPGTLNAGAEGVAETIAKKLQSDLP